MPIQPGSRLGPYEVLSAIGAGGMGEVWRAHDPRLGRDVAIKVLPSSFSADADRLRRFEQEARAAGILNHPNITAVLDIGEDAETGSPYVVQELLEGETLRQELGGGRLPARKAIEHAIQIATGLAAAHAKGIVHRDLKPENVFVTNDGHLKILDFGLARIVRPEADSPATNMPTATGGPGAAGTEPGMVLGTLGYMSPEQVRGRPADARSDIFSFGAILYEMLAGQRAFKGDSAADTMSAILREDPPEISRTNANIPPGIERIVRHCLEKNPEQRFQSARDLAFDLEALSGVSGASLASASTSDSASEAPPSGRRVRRGLAALGLLLLIGVGVASFFAGRGVGSRGKREVKFTPLTYRSLPIFRALFAPDGRTVIMSQAPEGNRPEIFTLSPEYPEPRSLGVTDAQLLSVSSRGELALLTHARYIHHRLFTGTLARMPIGGGAPREVLEGVREADFAPDGEGLAIIRAVDGKDRLEYPIGKVLYSTGGYVSDLRFSPRGDRIAFLEHPYRWDDRGGAAVVDLSGKKTDLSGTFGGVEGLAWSPDGSEILFSGGISWSSLDVHAVTLTGKDRLALGNGGGLTLFDINREGRWLGAREDIMYRLLVMAPGAKAERDLSWLNASKPEALSRDGRTLLFSDFSSASGDSYAVCIRKTDGSPVVRLGDGGALDLSPDGQWALGGVPSSPNSPDRLMLYPTGPGEPRRLESGAIREHATAVWFPDGKRILTCGTDEKRTSRCYVQAIDGTPKPLTAEGDRTGFVSPDGKQVLVQGNQDQYRIYSMEAGADAGSGNGRPVPALTPEDLISRWTSDSRGVLVYRLAEVPGRLERVDLATGRRELVHRLAPPDLAGVVKIYAAVVADDENVYAYNALMRRADLFLVDGAR